MGKPGNSSDIYCYYYVFISLCAVLQYVANCVFCTKRYSICVLKSYVVCLTSFTQYVKVVGFFFFGVMVLHVCFVFVVVIVIYQVDLNNIRFSVIYFIEFFPFVLISIELDMCVTSLIDI
jgi:hypothetical protein